jgi:hypothetical protein
MSRKGAPTTAKRDRAVKKQARREAKEKDRRTWQQKAAAREALGEGDLP